MKRRFFALLLVLSMVLSMLPSPAAAAAPEAEHTHTPQTDIPAQEQPAPTTPEESTGPVPLDSVFGAITNPLYGEAEDALGGVVYAPRYYSGGASAQSDYLTEDADVLEAIASGLEQRKEIITFNWKISAYGINTETDLENLLLTALYLSMSHTGEPARGDYLALSYYYLQYSLGENSYYDEDGYYYLEVIYQPYYYTTAQQEAALTAKLEEVMASFGFTAETDDYTKIKTIYDYICANVVYDYANLENEAYTLKFTAYAALINGTAVCQGYAMLLYRMLLMAGIDNRVIVGTHDGVGHAWNIVALDNFYYNVDSTWDAGYTEYHYFLKCPANFTEHTRDAEFETEEFHTYYPMAATDYVPGAQTAIASGTCGEGVNWVLGNDGILTVFGTGAMDDYASASAAPWYDYRDYVLGVVVEEGVAHVGNFAFAEYPRLYAVSVASGTIGKLAFYNCDALVAVDLLVGVENVGQQAFNDCDTLTAVSCAAQTLGWVAFSDCDALVAVDLLEGVKEIGNQVFSHCESLSTITFPTTVEKVGGAFFGCSSLNVYITDLAAWCGIEFSDTMANPIAQQNSKLYLNGELITDLVIPEGITSIGSYAFSCRAITSVSFPESLKTVGTGAFRQSGITQVTIPSTVTSLGGDAFEGSALISVTLKDGVTVLPDSIFKDCWQLETVNLNSTLQEIDSMAFYNCRKLKSMVLPATVTAIGFNSFAQCYEVESITFTGDAPSFGSDCFRSTPADLYYPCDNDTWTEESMDIFGSYTGYTWKKTHGEHREIEAKNPTCTEPGYTVGYQCVDCGDVVGSQDVIPATGHTEVPDIGVPPTCTEPGISDGKHCSVCGEILIAQETLPAAHQYVDSVCTVCGKVEYETSGTCGEGVNWALSADGTLTISGTGAMNDYISKAANPPWYQYRAYIKHIVIEEGITHVGNYAFSGIPTDHIVLPDSLTSIGNYSFNASGATSVTFGSGSLELGAYAFSQNNFVEVHVPDNVTAMGQYCFARCEKLETVSIGSGVKEILRDTFQFCTALKNVVLSEGLETLGFQVFWECPALTTLTLPASLKSIDHAFRDCKNLTKVIFRGDRPQFIGNAQNGTLGLSGVGMYPCTNPTWHEHIHIGYGTYWIPNHICENGVCTLCGEPEIYKYGQNGGAGAAIWTLDVNGTLTYYDDGVNPQVYVAGGLPALEYERLVKKIVFTEGVYAITSYAFNLYFENVDAMIFLGDAPIMEEYCFRDVTTTAYYPGNNPTWTASVMKDYGGNITWIAACTNGHTEVPVPGYGATCTEPGLTDGSKCSFCGVTLVEREPIEATGHTEVPVTGYGPTCTEPGLTDGTKCSVCDEPIVAQQPIEAPGHTEVPVIGYGATCTEPGLTDGTKCTTCGEMVVEQQPIEAPGHTEEPLIGYGATCTEPGLTDGVKCTTCGETLVPQEPIEATGHTEVPVIGYGPTCTEPGLTDGTKCSVCEEPIVAQEPIEATGHTEVPAIGYGPTCTEPGLTDGTKCSVCDEPIVAQQPIEATGHTEVPVTGYGATCTQPGLTDGTKCSVCDEPIVAQEPIPMDPHDFVDGTCTVCGAPEVYYLLGDVNLDGSVDSMDTNILFRYASEDPTLGELTEVQLQVADVNQDGSVDSMDTNILFRYASEDPTLVWSPTVIVPRRITL